MRKLRKRSGWSQFVLVATVVAFSLSLWLFLELADDAPEGDYTQIENRILLAFREAGDPAQPVGPSWLPGIGRDLTALGSPVVLILVILIAVGLLLLRRRYRSALLVLLATAGGYAINSGLKAVFGRDRPTAVAHLVEEASLSFPSGHSMVGAATYLTLGAMLAQTVARRREKIYFVGMAMLLSFFIGMSRVYLGVHYPTDVLAGWAGGTAWAIGCWFLAGWLQSRGAIRTPPDNDSRDAERIGPS